MRWLQTAALMTLAAVCCNEWPSLSARALVRPTRFLSPQFIKDGVASPERNYAVRWVPSDGQSRTASVRVLGIDRATLKRLQSPRWKSSDWTRVLAIYVDAPSTVGDTGLPAMLGRYSIHSDELTFEPQFPLEPGVTYRAVFHPGQLSAAHSSKAIAIVASFRLPPTRTTSTTEVRQVFPTSSTVPENLLKFYVYFSAPMSRGNIYAHIHLRSKDGHEVELPFLEIDEELWDPTMTRLTLFIDPGRIKRGVRPLEEIGPALEVGKEYSLTIDSGWKDGSGNSLRTNFEKRFRVLPPDRDPPDPARWQIQVPQAGKQDSLMVDFPESMDQALAQRAIQVTTASGEVLDGIVALENEEKRWSFLPANPWRPGIYRLVVPTTLEDLAGNNIGKPFEVDLFEGVKRTLTTPTVKLPFEVR